MLLKLAWNNIVKRPFSSGLSVLLLASSIMIIILSFLTMQQIESKFNENANKIDLVVGAKGSRLQLVLCNVFHVDNPTGNIRMKDVTFLTKHPFVKNAIPISLGDNYKSYRIVGTNQNFLQKLYKAPLKQGKLFEKPYEVVLGFNAANKMDLKLGDSFYGSHGIDASIHEHQDAKYLVVGLLDYSGEVIDNLILTSLESVWQVHSEDHQKGSFDLNYEKKHDHHHHKITLDEEDKEITALLVNYKSQRAKFSIPGIVNNKEQLMAAEPSIEIQRLLDLVQPAVKVVTVLAWFIFGLAFFSMLITMINSMKNRKYEIAMMRASGATSKLVLISILTEGFLIAFIGGLLGVFMGHIFLEIMGQYLTNHYHYQFSGLVFNYFELWLLIGTIATGIISAFIPAIAAYNMDISSTLKKKI
ncbi:MAG: ABC transporter permease [Crocinitomicaceae bacterium]|jgi:putative ABC transport system permease protein|nr:ABC transporter permease [Crocinitomicaceae bacterium]